MNVKDVKIRTELKVVSAYLKEVKKEEINFETEKKIIKATAILDSLINLINWEDTK